MALSLVLNSPRLATRKALTIDRSQSHENNKEISDTENKKRLGKENPVFHTENGGWTEIELTDLTKQPEENPVSKNEETTLPADGSPGEPSDPKAEGIRERRQKMIRTIILLYTYSTLGLIYGQMGPTLPDLQKISGAPLEKASWIFTGFAIGYLVGCLLGGLLHEKVSPYLSLFLYTIGNAITNAIIPWIPKLVAMVINRLATGFFIGCQDTVIHTMLLSIWSKQGGRFIHMTHILAAAGGVLSPLITEPFVSSEQSNPAPMDAGYSDANDTTETINITRTQHTTASSVSMNDSNIHFAFLITAVITTTAAIPNLYIYFQEKKVKPVSRQRSNEGNKKTALPSRRKRLILCILIANSCLATACIDMFPSFLTTFLIEQLTWKQSSGTILTSIYFGTYGLGNLIAAIMHEHITTSVMIALSYIAAIVSLVTLLLGVVLLQTATIIWLTVALTGLASAVILPSLFTWIEEHVTPVTGRIASALLFSGSAGVMANPLLLGYFMDNFTPMWFLYFSLAEPTCCAILFTVACVVLKTYTVGNEKVEATIHSDNERHVDGTNNIETDEPQVMRQVTIVRL